MSQRVKIISFSQFESNNRPVSDLKGRARKNAWSYGAESFFLGVDRDSAFRPDWIRDAYYEGFNFAKHWSDRSPHIAVACDCCERLFWSQEEKLQ